jgi:hypothetical protein
LGLRPKDFFNSLKVQGALTAGSDESDFFHLSYDDCGYYAQITCFNTDGGSIDFNVYVYDGGGSPIASYTSGTYLVGSCCAPNGAPGVYYIEVRRTSGGGFYSLHIYAT